ncbi:GPI inositol deacylase [Mortierella sp. AM989]|nr:GPI inositol deacylase [Mortierella sp. AM989]
MDNFLPGSVNTILTIATPHMVPPLALDYTITNIYDKIEAFWATGYDVPHAALANVSLVSVMGGNQDITVNSDSGNIHHIVPQNHGFSVFTSSVPHAWVGSDHLSILWCNQVVKQIGAALVEAADARTPYQVKSLGERLKIFRNHLLSEDPLSISPNSEVKETINLSDVSHSFEEGYPWVSPTRKPAGINQHASISHYHIFAIPKHEDLDTLTLLTSLKFGTRGDFSLLLCKHKSEQVMDEKILVCEANNLPSTTIPCSTKESTMPLFTGEYFTRKEFLYVSAPVSDLRKFQYVVFLNRRGIYSSPNFVIVEFRNKASTTEVVHTTAIAGSQARFTPMMKQSNWATNEDRFSVNIASKEAGVDINFHGDLPYYDKVLLQANNGIELQFWRDPTCNEPLSLTLTVDKYGSLGKVVIRYRTTILVFTFMVVVLTVRAQIKDWGRSGFFKPFGVILSNLIRTTFWKFSLLLVFVSFIQSLKPKKTTILSTDAIADAVQTKSGFWISSDWFDNALLGRNETFFWLLIPIFLHLAVGVVTFVWLVLSTIVRASSILARLVTGSGHIWHR